MKTIHLIPNAKYYTKNSTPAKTEKGNVFCIRFGQSIFGKLETLSLRVQITRESIFKLERIGIHM